MKKSDAEFKAFLKKVHTILDKSPIFGDHKEAIGVEWCTGGVTGGSYMDSEDSDPHSHFEGDPEPEFEDLDLLLEKICPTISFLTYKRMLRTLLQRDTRYEAEFYGNSSNYASKWVDLWALFSFLQTEKLL